MKFNYLTTCIPNHRFNHIWNRSEGAKVISLV
jgi:hypothetical protein